MAAHRIRLAVLQEMYDAVLTYGTVMAASIALGIPPATGQRRFDRAKQELGLPDLRQTARRDAVPYDPTRHPECALVATETAQDATVLIFSDAHWTVIDQPRSLAHEAMLAAIPHIQPTHIVAAGDMLDMTQPSRHPPIGWGVQPRVRDEIDTGRLHLGDIVALAPKAARWWVRGNHDDRFDRWLAANAGAFADVAGLCLADHFPDWRMCWRLDFNDAVIWHANHNGIHAAWNDALKAGLTTVSGHNHALEVKPITDMRGRRWGIKSGMLGDPAWPCFHYAGANPRMWGQGWVVLTWHNGVMRPPELCEVADGIAWFRGHAMAGRTRRRAGKS